MKKEKEEIVIELPTPTLQPINGRIYCIGITQEDVKTKAGIIIPVDFTKIKGEEKQEWNFKRYFVCAVANDVNINLYDPKIDKERRIKRGDEVSIFYHEDALRYLPAEVMDFGAKTKFIAFHETEIAGVTPSLILNL